MRQEQDDVCAGKSPLLKIASVGTDAPVSIAGIKPSPMMCSETSGIEPMNIATRLTPVRSGYTQADS